MNVSSVSSFLKKPVFLIVTSALLIRLILMPLLTYDYDIYHWGLIISNIDSGNNLYNLDGYYYTPVWGYLLGFVSTIQQFLVNIGPTGIRFTELLGIENLEYPYHTATITSIAFNICMKIPLVLCDFAVGYLIYWLIKDRTGSSKKATYGLAFWLFCPIVIYMSGIQAMFDTFAALFLLLTVIMFYKDRCFIGGVLFAMAVLLKFFPAFCIFVLLAYVVAKHRGHGLAKRKFLESVLGMMTMSAILMLPLILNGQLGIAFSFVFGRTGDAGFLTMMFLVVNAAIALLCAVFFGYKMFRSSANNADESMFLYVLFTVAAATLISITPQYVIVIMPLLILLMVGSDKSYLKCWVIISVSAFFGAFILNNYSLFAALAGYTTFVSPDWLISGMQFLESGTPINLASDLAFVSAVVQYAGILLLIIFGLSEIINEKVPKLGRIVVRIKKWRVDNEA